MGMLSSLLDRIYIAWEFEEATGMKVELNVLIYSQKIVNRPSQLRNRKVFKSADTNSSDLASASNKVALRCFLKFR
jgi:hypothetical protein